MNPSANPNLPPVQRAPTSITPQYPPPPYGYSTQNQQDGRQMQAIQVDYPPQLPPLFRGQKVKSGPFNVTVTDDMVAERERENRELYRQWLAEQERRNMTPEEIEYEQYAMEFRNAKIRRNFIKKVYCIISAQLAFTAGFVALAMYEDSMKLWILMRWQLSIVAAIAFLITYMALVCIEAARRLSPCNWILLCLLTLAQSYCLAFLSVHYNVELVLLALGMTSFVSVVVTLVATFIKFDFTSHSGMICIIAIVVTVSVLILAIVAILTEIKVLWVIISSVVTLLFSVYLFYETQMIMGGRDVELDPEEYIFAAVLIYVNIVMMFKYILMCLGCLTDS